MFSSVLDCLIAFVLYIKCAFYDDCDGFCCFFLFLKKYEKTFYQNIHTFIHTHTNIHIRNQMKRENRLRRKSQPMCCCWCFFLCSCCKCYIVGKKRKACICVSLNEKAWWCRWWWWWVEDLDKMFSSIFKKLLVFRLKRIIEREQNF